MKKSVLALAMAFGVTSAFAQDLTSKKGEPILPEAGDWAIGIDASPFLNYAGQMLSNSGATSPGFQFLNSNQTIIGKMFKDEKTAYRAIIRLGKTSNTKRADIGDATSTATLTYPALATMKEDKWKHSTSFIGLGAGMEMRRGKTRLQGYYGGEFMFWMSSSKDKYTYGNALATGTPGVSVSGATTTDWSGSGGVNMTTDTYGNSARVTEWKSGSTIGFGVRGFIGAEYFILPKISIGGEFGWGIGVTSTGKTHKDIESRNAAGTDAVGTQEIVGKKGGSLAIDTDQNMFGTGTATLRMNLHF